MKNMRIQLYATLACFLLTLGHNLRAGLKTLCGSRDKSLYGERFILYKSVLHMVRKRKR